MASLKTKTLIAIILAVLSALLLAEATLLVFPQQEKSMPIPLPQANSASELVWSIQWLGFAVLVSFLIVGAILVVKRVFQPKTSLD